MLGHDEHYIAIRAITFKDTAYLREQRLKPRAGLRRNLNESRRDGIDRSIDNFAHSRTSVAPSQRRTELNDSMIAKHPENLFSQLMKHRR